MAGEWIEKAWGRTRDLHCNGSLEIIECEIVKGGFSSLHRHAAKSNEFMVVSGRLLLHIDDCPGGRVRELTPSTGCYCVAAGVGHQFSALEPTVLIEFYHGVQPSKADIERFTTGGVE